MYCLNRYEYRLLLIHATVNYNNSIIFIVSYLLLNARNVSNVWNMFKTIFSLVLVFPIATIALNVGTALYSVDDVASKTWTSEDVAILRARMLMDRLIPKNVVSGRSFLTYARLIVKKIETISSDRARTIAIVAACDAIGAYLQGVMLPHVKDGYYKGHESYEVTNELHSLERKIKFILDTDGRGWMTAVDVGQLSRAATAKNDDVDNAIFEETENPCAALLTDVVPSDGKSIVDVPVPAFDDNTYPGSLAFPFVVGKRLFTVDRPWLTVDDRRPLLVRYYRLAVGCTSPAPQQFRENMHRWLDTVVVPLLADRNRWFPVLAGATRVVRAAAKAASDDATLGGRHKRKATAIPAANFGSGGRGGSDDDFRRSCDDETNDRLPNVNVSMAVILSSLLSTWLAFWAFGSIRYSLAVTYSRKPDTIFNL